MTHDALVEIAKRWLQRPWRSGAPEGHSGCSVVITELSTWGGYGEIPDAIGFSSSQLKSILVECKTSLSDFRADKKKVFRFPDCENFGMGDQRYYIAPEDVIPEVELPEGWGLVEVHDDGKTYMKRPSKRWEKCAKAEINLLLSVLCRLRIEPGGHIAIRAFTDIFGGRESKNKASVTISRPASASREEPHDEQ